MAIPMMAGTAVHTLYIVVDTAFIGSLGTEALAAATFVGPVFFVMITLTMGLSTAVTALIAQAIGRREPAGGDRVAGTAMTVGILIGLLLSLVGNLLGRSALVALGASGPVTDLAWEYFEVITYLAPLFFISSNLRAVLNGEGDARTPTLVLTASTALNIGLDALFIFGLGLGLRGAALATGSAQLFSLLAFIVLIARRKRAYVTMSLANFVPSLPVLWRITALAVPTAAGMMVMSIGGAAFNRMLSEFGDVAVAAYGAASKVDMIVGMPIFGLAGATVTVVGMFAGAKRIDLVRTTALYAYRWALTMALFIGASAYLASDAILAIFTRDEAALTIGRTYLAFMIFTYPAMAIGMTTGRLLQGLGHGIPSLIITSIRVLLVAVPAAYVAVYVLETPVWGVWTAILIGAASSTLVSIVWVYLLVWRRDPTARATERVSLAEAASDAVESTSDERPAAAIEIE